ncbi:hypothetical protein CAEBREN_12055 [Caenorhabditis brenneri]|uniref:Small integral membrane protein 15 n=1 Tax=Caenorhabditis brenneri TaxID=135651 RepID=G0N458_CAEBE|nr:hypothetical protein CAEBREN_12055 [Caenorhabditis brenneri]
MSSTIRHQLQQIYWRIVDHPFDSIESILAIIIPLGVVALMFQWRVKQSMKKQKKLAARRERLMKKLKKYENGGAGEDEEDDDVIKEAIKLMEEKAKKLN